MDSLDLTNILNTFPNIKLSYENIVYKKVYNNDLILAIPEGKKCFTWFTIYREKPTCFIMELDFNSKIKNIKIVNASFSFELFYGTIFYGTLFRYKDTRFFTIEDIFYLKGKEIERQNWGSKFTILSNILKNDMKQEAYNNSFIVFGLPLISNNLQEILNKISNVKYNVENIHFLSFNRINNYFKVSYKNLREKKIIVEMNYVNYEKSHNQKQIVDQYNNKSLTNNNSLTNNKYLTNNNSLTYSHNKNQKCINKNPIEKPNIKNILKKESIFNVKADIQDDIYHLYSLNEKSEEDYIGIASIPDYKTSVFMNNLFRNIKENKNLDALEESDDEEEFENENEDKFVFLDRSFKIICFYNYKFKKWVPIKLANPN